MKTYSENSDDQRRTRIEELKRKIRDATDRRLPSLSDMRRTAWILRTDEKRKTIGFVSNQQWRKSKEFQNRPYWGDEDD